MITYFVVSERERKEFEMRFQAPYGYHLCPYFQTEEGATEYVDNMIRHFKRNDLVVEKLENGKCETIYRSGWYKESIYDEQPEEMTEAQ